MKINNCLIEECKNLGTSEKIAFYVRKVREFVCKEKIYLESDIIDLKKFVVEEAEKERKKLYQNT